MEAHFPNAYINQCSTPNTRDIKWTQIYLMSTLIYALPPNIRDKMDEHLPDVYLNQCSTPKTRDIKWTLINLMSTLINALPRTLVILNGRTFASCLL